MDKMKYYRQIKAALIVAFIVLICLWLFGCTSFTETDLPKSQLVKTPFFKGIKTATAVLSDYYAITQKHSPMIK
jgi:hypothetical protein